MSLKKRIIPCLDIKDGRTVKGINFVGLRDAGDPVELAKQYAAQGADELCFLDITATIEKRDTLVPLVREIAAVLNIPFTVGGGINDVALAKEIIKAGADKIAINSAAVKRPELISELAAELGSQCVVVAVDTKHSHESRNPVDSKNKPDESTPTDFRPRGNKVYVAGGRVETELETISWCQEIERLGAGEILLTSMDHDGTKNGFALELTDAISRKLSIPIIASGGGGTSAHFADLFKDTEASAGLAASIFHFGELPVPELKKQLAAAGVDVRIPANAGI
ncbi:imidazole glycerol phosphate synthase cyclase subunit [Nonlabens ulvanivorans]|uniref:Imidazole glycerol phosphate synthase subunit HisF n=1 Tax=Nonlabens ulvanivorans TaxID=906888 RepID=A0A090WBZ2_NONUL|nr:imidazole glycerol phosphate synthase subunit HisF [Nonlabens ulvanivorans]GAL00600.1 imidazole glycerol phosphate synthase cyclase subunit [Nonlabens ulvanivorans]GAL74495.1 imidazole glycerol phosphate synthase cyclase subunit [Nonlabens ulvanivorans]